MTNPQNEQMPDNPGAPEATDPEYVSPDQAETLADEAAESEALATDEDPLLAADAELEDAAKIAENEIDPDADGDGAVSDIELQLAERTESLQRVSAEYANYRRRTERERGELANTASAASWPTPRRRSLPPSCCRFWTTWNWPSSTATWSRAR